MPEKKEATLPQFAVGSQVRVKRGVVSPQYPDLSLEGWCGKVYQVSGTNCFVHWNWATLEAVRTVHRDRWQQDDMDCQAIWLQEEMLEVDPGEPLCIAQGHGVELLS